uniref:Receptor expression-enhancing protein n=1 Tax=Strongyloides venezuelensis TaxID=75913 RepID=A0A0K0F9A2_STRVS
MKKVTRLIKKFPQLDKQISIYEKTLEIKRQTIVGLIIFLFCRLLYNADGFYSISQFIAIFIPVFLTVNSFDDQTKEQSILSRKYWIFFGFLNMFEIVLNCFINFNSIYNFLRLCMFVTLFTCKIENVEIFLDYIISITCDKTIRKEEEKSVLDTAKEFIESISLKKSVTGKKSSILETL